MGKLMTRQEQEPLACPKIDFEGLSIIHEMILQIDSHISTLLTQEGNITFGLGTLLTGTEYTTQQIESVDENLNSLTESNELTKEQVNQVMKGFARTGQEVVSAKEGIHEMVEEMQKVTVLFEDFYSMIIQTQKEFENIRGLASSITSISSRTNLLSLNASIEAARVGEAGRGFSVVAEEIKKLSDTSKKSASDILGALEHMNTAMESLSKKTTDGKEVVTITTGMTEKSLELLDHIVEAEEEVRGHVEEVEKSQKISLKNIEKIAENVESIVSRSKKENADLDDLINGVQNNAKFYKVLLNHLKQIRIIVEQDGEH